MSQSYSGKERKEGSDMRVFLIFLLMMTSGVAGLVMFFGDNMNLMKLILSKPIGIVLLTASYMLFKRLNKEYQTYLNHNKNVIR